MADYCTCGVELPPDALFCHKCGKPQREESLLEPAEVFHPEPIEPRPEVPPPAPDIGFHNAMAVRVGFLAGSLAFLLSTLVPLLPVPPFTVLAIFLGTGAFAVHLYNRRSKMRLSVGNGARIGWMSGLFCFAIVLLLFTVEIVLMSTVAKEPGTIEFLRTQLSAKGLSEQAVGEFIEVLENPWRMGGLLVFLFFFCTGLTTAGGALGAKISRRD